MGYMERNIEKRLDPRNLVESARSVISVILNYFPENTLPEDNNYKLSKYAYGRDYHKVIRKKLKSIINLLKEEGKSENTRGFTDSAPVLDRAWAQRAGLGWIGKNTCLINVKHGSFLFIGEIITDVELEYDNSFDKDFCGGCTKCLDACPTNAIIAPRILDSRKCISYLTIEHKSNLPEELKASFEDWIFGCDVCQDVCPWNRTSKPHTESSFEIKKKLFHMTKEDWENLPEEEFDELFIGSAVKRTGFHGLSRNIKFNKNI
jgi:epoxyqueuosine reductase